MKKVLIIRFSALGDVAMTVPVVYSVAREHPDVHFVFLTRERFSSLFLNAPSNLEFLGVDLKNYEGAQGLYRLYELIEPMGFDGVADLHNVTRSIFLAGMFQKRGVPVSTIRKGRFGKMRLTSRYFKRRRQLKTSFVRYMEVFRRLGLGVEPQFTSLFETSRPSPSILDNFTSRKQPGEHWIGIAPFAKYDPKIYPIDLMQQVVEGLASGPDTRIFLFGYGPKEEPTMNLWADRFSNVVSTAGWLNAEQELFLISQLDVMLSMDSANMHLASIVGTPVVSIWGGTHPYAGFLGWGQKWENCVQTDLPCRPCSTFGAHACFRGDLACLRQITPQQVIDRISQNLRH